MILFKKIFLYVILKMFTKFKFPTMPATGQKVCGVGGVVGGGCLKPILVFSLASSWTIVQYLCFETVLIDRIYSPNILNLKFGSRIFIILLEALSKAELDKFNYYHYHSRVSNANNAHNRLDWKLTTYPNMRSDCINTQVWEL